MDFDLSDLKMIILSLVVSVAIIGLCVLLGFGASSFSCAQTGKALNLKANYSFFAGCVITKKDGTKVLLEQLRGFN